MCQAATASEPPGLIATSSATTATMAPMASTNTPSASSTVATRAFSLIRRTSGLITVGPVTITRVPKRMAVVQLQPRIQRVVRAAPAAVTRAPRVTSWRMLRASRRRRLRSRLIPPSKRITATAKPTSEPSEAPRLAGRTIPSRSGPSSTPVASSSTMPGMRRCCAIACANIPATSARAMVSAGSARGEGGISGILPADLTIRHMPTPPNSSARPVVIAGMHRSGTSLVANFLSSLGVHMGDRLLPADARNPHGYFEDADFVALHGRILSAATVDEPGHRDWGWTESERLDRGRLPGFLDEARALAAGRAGRSGIWGWKDPRTTVLLDFWDEILGGEALYVLVYRFPWEVADSMQRLGADVFLRHPEWAYPIWTFYNRQLLDFHRRHPDRSVLARANGLLRDPARFVDLLRGKLGLSVADAPLDGVRDRDLFVSLPADDPLIPLVAATSPACAQVLGELDAQADLPATGLWSAPPLRGDRWRPEGPVDLSVVIPCYDLGELLVEALASAERSAPSAARSSSSTTARNSRAPARSSAC